MSGSGPGQHGNEGESFEARLKAARERQGLAPPSAPRDRRRADGLPTSALGIGLRVGIELVSALVLGAAIGWGLYRWVLHTPVVLAVFVLMGGAAGVLNVWRLMKPRDGAAERGE